MFGNLYYRDARQDNAYHSKGYTSHTFDSESGLTYAHARYLDTTVHSFLSVDPMQYNLTRETLYDPQSLNGYTYARNNSVLFNDPTGKYIGWDDAAALGMGAVVGVGLYSMTTLMSGDRFTVGGFVGAAASGAIIGEAALYAPATGGASILAAAGAGGVASGVGTALQQRIDDGNVNWNDVGESAAIGFGLGGLSQGIIPNLSVDGITSGSYSWFSTRSGLITKLKSGAIHNVSISSTLKMSAAQQVADSVRGVAVTTAAQYISTNSNHQGLTPAQFDRFSQSLSGLLRELSALIKKSAKTN